MTEDAKKKLNEAREQIDIRLGGLFSELGSALTEMLDRIDTEGSAEVRREHEFETPRGPIRAQTGIRIRTLGGAQTERRGRDPAAPVNPDRAPQQKRAKAPGDLKTPPRTISAEIFEDDASWVLTADLPGIVETDLTLSEEGGDLVIEANGRGRRYRDHVTLPDGVSIADIVVTLQNGILELRASRRAGGSI